MSLREEVAMRHRGQVRARRAAVGDYSSSCIVSHGLRSR